jgi:hypothetical protein
MASPICRSERPEAKRISTMLRSAGASRSIASSSTGTSEGFSAYVTNLTHGEAAAFQIVKLSRQRVDVGNVFDELKKPVGLLGGVFAKDCGESEFGSDAVVDLQSVEHVRAGAQESRWSHRGDQKPLRAVADP